MTHIPLHEGNKGKLAALDDLAVEYMRLCQAYVTRFCTEQTPDGFAEMTIASPLSERWQRCAVMQAAGIAKSWRSNRTNAYDAYQRRLKWFESLSKDEQEKHQKPEWNEFKLPNLQATCLQASINVVEELSNDDKALALTPAEKGVFDFWLQIATLTYRKPIYIPVKLADYHKAMLKEHERNSSVTLNKRDGVWWLTVSYDVEVNEPALGKPILGIDVGMTNFITTSAGEHYGTFSGDLAARHQRVRKKTQDKAKLRACLEKRKVETLPSTSSEMGQRFSRHVKQEINRAVNQVLNDHPDVAIALEDLSVSSMRFKAKQMNSALRASQLGHIPDQFTWVAAQRGIELHFIDPAYTSQECPLCHFTDRANRPEQQTFCCKVCGHAAHADVNAALNITRRVGDTEFSKRRTLETKKKLLLSRHEAWLKENGCP